MTLNQYTPLRARWEVKVRRDPSGCWIWTAKRSGRGYGIIQHQRRRRLAHVVGYELLIGPVPQGLELDHVCRNHPCVNPAHLEPVTHIENVRRGDAGKAQREKTHCARGHQFTAENTYHSTQRGRQRRACKTCRRDARRRFDGFTGKGRWPSSNIRIR